MGILKGALSARRYRVPGEVPENFRDVYQSALAEHAFREPLSETHKEAFSGWVRSQNLLDTDFDDLNLWLYNQYALFSLRTDKKVLPAKLFAAHLQKRCAEWCVKSGRERVPAKVKEELKELLEQEMLQKTLPRVQVTEVVWNVAEGWLLFHSQSTNTNDNFLKLFHRTFGIALQPFDPLDFVGDQPELAARLVSVGATDLRDLAGADHVD